MSMDPLPRKRNNQLRSCSLANKHTVHAMGLLDGPGCGMHSKYLSQTCVLRHWEGGIPLIIGAKPSAHGVPDEFHVLTWVP